MLGIDITKKDKSFVLWVLLRIVIFPFLKLMISYKNDSLCSNITNFFHPFATQKIQYNVVSKKMYRFHFIKRSIILIMRIYIKSNSYSVCNFMHEVFSLPLNPLGYKMCEVINSNWPCFYSIKHGIIKEGIYSI